MTSSSSLLEYGKLYYLDLALQHPFRKIVTSNQNKHSCYFRTKTFTHCLRSEASHLNTIIDLLISLGTSLESQQKNIFRTLDQLSTSLVQQNQLLSELRQNLDYLKESQGSLNRRFSQLNLTSIPTRRIY